MQNEKQPHDGTRAFVEQLVAWASFAYGCGFVVVLLHTARLGLPVLDLIKPIYVWIGLPFAILGFFSKRLFSWVRVQATLYRDELVRSLRQSIVDEFDDDAALIAKFLDSLASVLPWYLPSRLFSAVFRRLLERAYRKITLTPDRAAALVRFVDRYLRALRIYKSVISLVNLIALVGAVVAGIYFYVWEVYPRIPQAYGGGSAHRVRLFVDGTKLPADIRHLTATGLPPASGVPLMTPPLDLLYQASNTVWVRTLGGAVVGLEKSVVTGIVYEEGSGLTGR